MSDASGRLLRLPLAALLLALTWMALAPGGALAAPDFDGDGHTADDCAPLDSAVHPGAPDRPDLALFDSNCDGVDGDAARAYFVSTTGSDATGSGSKAFPFATIGKAIDKAAQANPVRDVYIAGGTYTERVVLKSGVGLYGGYQPAGGRSTGEGTTIQASPTDGEAVFADAGHGVVLQLLTVQGSAGTGESGRSAYGLRAVGGGRPPESGRSAYAIRAIGGSSLALEAVTAQAGAARAGALGVPGNPGTDGLVGGCGWSDDQGPCSHSGGAGGVGGPGGLGDANRGGAGG